MCRRRSDTGNACRGADPKGACSGFGHPGRQRRGFDDAPAKGASSAWPLRQGVRRALYHRQASHLWTIHRLTYRRSNHENIHVRGYNEEGTTTTPFDMTVLNGLDRYHLVHSVLDWVPELKGIRVGLKQAMDGKLLEHRAYIRAHGQDMPEIRDWKWVDDRPLTNG